MGRKNKNIEVEIQETKKNTETYADLEIVVNKKIIGTVSQEENEQAYATYKSGREIPVRSVEEGIETVIAEYNLHDQ